MRFRVKILSLFVTLLALCWLPAAFGMLSMELTHGVTSAIPIAVPPFAGEQAPGQEAIASIIGNDLKNSGRFKTQDQRAGANYAVAGSVTQVGDQYDVNVKLIDLFQNNGQALFTQHYTVTASQWRAVAHHISDLIYEQITGTRGVFSTKIAYVVVNRANLANVRYDLEVADQDGYNPRPLLDSPEPIMSPSWSPNGHEVAYVSFEDQHASIYIEDVTTGARHLLTDYEGINGAPAWSPDGKQLALVLSKSGSPNIYVMDIASKHLTQVTHDIYINTEPAWSADGQSLLYTSDRGGGPQIYQINLATGSSQRLTFDGSYNARASFTRDGKYIAMIHRVDGIYSIAMQNLDTGTVQVLSGVDGNTSSPSVAPNSSMVLYDVYMNGRNMLGMVSSDGRIQLVLPARNGDAQDPAWSPFLS